MVEAALYASKICSYAQGMALLQVASHECNYGLRLGEIARIWRGGSIIRSRLLDKIRLAFERDPTSSNLLLAPEFAMAAKNRQDGWRLPLELRLLLASLARP